ncbi:NUDIX domain-containing protein [Candidatus Pacearchaeota archaeon]|nr:NUDIX domain-containing protein [Candidatus Pacearchaeota archaeon]
MADKHIVAITGAIIKDGKYLIIKRNPNKKIFPGKWTVPGGRLELEDYIYDQKDTGEHWYNIIEKVLRREVREEVGLEIGKIDYLTSLTFFNENEPILVISMYAPYIKGKVVLNDENIDYKWVSLEEAKTYDLIEGIYEELEMLDKKLKGQLISEWKKDSLIIEDKVYGREEIKEKILVELINSKPVQRLRHIFQYGMPDEYYHKKNFSRYEHSIGVMILLRRLNASLKEQIAGLLHDVSHTAFCHVIDWVIGDPSKEDFQDNNHLNFILNSEIKFILEKYNYGIREIADIDKFSLLEREIPGLCADRVDYCLRELDNESISVDFFTSSLINQNEQICFKHIKVAEKFATEFLRLQNEHWAGKQARCRYFILSRILKKALDYGIISLQDFYSTDKEIIEKLANSNDPYITEHLTLLKEGLLIEEVDDGGILLKKKFRYVDPEVLIDNKIKRLSELSPYFSNLLRMEKERNKIEKGIIFKKL